MGGCKSKREGGPEGEEKVKPKKDKDADQQHSGSPNQSDNPPAEIHPGEPSTNRTKGAGKIKSGSGVSNLEDEKKAIADNVRRGQFLDYYFVGPEIGRY
jgi:hypothetical protein